MSKRLDEIEAQLRENPGAAIYGNDLRALLAVARAAEACIALHEQDELWWQKYSTLKYALKALDEGAG